MDSSAFVKLFVQESGSQNLIDFFLQSRTDAIHVSMLATLEVRSAIRRREKAADFSNETSEVSLEIMAQAMQHVIESSLTASVLAQATSIIDRHTLRALDALQLASAITARSALRPPEQLLFVASDIRLLRAAAVEQFVIWNPVDGPAPTLA